MQIEVLELNLFFIVRAITCIKSQTYPDTAVVLFFFSPEVRSCYEEVHNLNGNNSQSCEHDSFNQVLLIKSILSLLQKLIVLDENLQKIVYNTPC